jgi:uncharacterized membrane protein
MYAYFRQTFGPIGGDDAGPIREWRIRRNCSLTPRQSLSATLVSVALVLAMNAASVIFFRLWFAVPFAMLYASAIVAAFVAYAKHATDGETLRLVPPFVIVEIDDGVRHTVHRMNATRLTVCTDEREHMTVYLCDGWQRIPIGRQLPVSARAELAEQLRRFVDVR